ncbi:MAG: hypothetical protein JSS07_08585 [Proteobacteria bacterium]|nr:hypothetical protein [Pseudomonadota bacterium]
MLNPVNTAISQNLLNMIGTEIESKPWQQSFYVRHVQQIVKLNIEEMDFANEKDMALINKLMHFVDNWHTLPSKDFQLAAQLNNFKLTAKHLPVMVNYKFENHSLFMSAQKAYQKLVLLEIVNYIDATQAKFGKDAQEQNKIDLWIKKQQFKLQPSRMDFLFYKTSDIFNSIFGDSITWLGQNAPYIIKFYAQNMFKVARQKPTLKGLAIGYLNSIYFAFNLLLGTIFRGIHLLLLPLVGLANLTTKHLVINILHSFCFFGLLYKSLLFLPALMVALKATTALFAVAAFTSSVLFLSELLLQKCGINWRLTDDSALFQLDEFIATWVGTFFRLSIPFAINETLPHLHAVYKKLKILIEYGNKLNLEVDRLTDGVIDNNNYEQRKALFSNYEMLYDNFTNLAREGVVDFIANHYEISIGQAEATVPSIANQFVNLETIALALRIEPQKTTTQNAPNVLGIDKPKLIARLMRLKVDKDIAQNHGAEVADIVKNIPNPTVYVNQYRNISDLPEALRQFAQPAQPVQQHEIDDEMENENGLIPTL